MYEFFEAVRNGDTHKALSMIEADASLLARKENGVSPVLLALYHGNADLARQLAERSQPLPLHEACAIGDVERVRALLRGDPNAVTTFSDDGYGVLGYGTFFGHPEVDRVVLEFDPDVNAAARNAQKVAPVHAAAAVCNHEMLKTLLERGADPNARQQMDYRPLHTAAARGDIEMAKLLLEHGANRDVRGTDGKSPRDIAADHKHAAFVEWWDRGAN